MSAVASASAWGKIGDRTKLVTISMGGLEDIGQKSLKINNIRELRDRRGWTQAELAKRMGTSQQQVDRLEKSDRTLTWPWMRRLAKAFGCHPMDLVDWP